MLDFLIEYMRPGPLGGISILIGGAWYIHRIVSKNPNVKRVVPNRTSWTIWAVIDGIIALCFGLTEPGEIEWIAYAMFVEVTLVAVLSYWYGEGGPAEETDLICIKLTGLTLMAWFIAWLAGVGKDSITVVLAAELLICCYGAIPTLKKAWKEPEHEGRGPWFFTLIGYILGLVAVIVSDHQTFDAWMYALVALFIIDGPIAVVLLLRPDQSLAPGQTKLYPGLRGLIRV